MTSTSSSAISPAGAAIWSSARQHWEQAIAFNPEHALARANLAGCGSAGMSDELRQRCTAEFDRIAAAARPSGSRRGERPALSAAIVALFKRTEMHDRRTRPRSRNASGNWSTASRRCRRVDGRLGSPRSPGRIVAHRARLERAGRGRLGARAETQLRQALALDADEHDGAGAAGLGNDVRQPARRGAAGLPAGAGSRAGTRVGARRGGRDLPAQGDRRRGDRASVARCGAHRRCPSCALRQFLAGRGLSRARHADRCGGVSAARRDAGTQPRRGMGRNWGARSGCEASRTSAREAWTTGAAIRHLAASRGAAPNCWRP